MAAEALMPVDETTHRALYLNQRKDILPEQVEVWMETRLLIIDEISFASKDACHEGKRL